MALLFPRRYRYIAARCSRHNRQRRYASVDAVLRAVRRTDRWLQLLPVAVLFLLLAAGVGMLIHGQQDAQMQMGAQQEQLGVQQEQMGAQQEQLHTQQKQIQEQQAYIRAQQDSLTALRASLADYQKEDALIASVIGQSASIFNARVRTPYKQGRFVYLQDVMEAIEKGRKEVDDLVKNVKDDALRTKAHSAAYDVWVHNYNNFFEEEDPFKKLPMRPM